MSARKRRATPGQATLPFKREDPTDGLEEYQLRELRAAIADLLVEAVGTNAGEDEDDE